MTGTFTSAQGRRRGRSSPPGWPRSPQWRGIGRPKPRPPAGSRIRGTGPDRLTAVHALPWHHAPQRRQAGRRTTQLHGGHLRDQARRAGQPDEWRFYGAGRRNRNHDGHALNSPARTLGVLFAVNCLNFYDRQAISRGGRADPAGVRAQRSRRAHPPLSPFCTRWPGCPWAAWPIHVAGASCWRRGWLVGRR